MNSSTATSSSTSVSIECAVCCVGNLCTPEELCEHMQNYHGMNKAVIETITFSDKVQFQVRSFIRIQQIFLAIFIRPFNLLFVFRQFLVIIDL